MQDFLREEVRTGRDDEGFDLNKQKALQRNDVNQRHKVKELNTETVWQTDEVEIEAADINKPAKENQEIIS